MIYFPGRNYTLFGGAEVLILNIATFLSVKNEKIGLIGIPNYSLCNILTERNIPFVFIDQNDLENLYFQKDDLFVIFTFTNDLLNIQGNPKIIVWNILSYSLMNWNITKLDKYLKPIFGKQIFWPINRMLFNKLSTSDSLFFMDGMTLQMINKYYKSSIEPNFMQIPIPTSPYLYSLNKKTNEISITYLGRGNEIWKITPVIQLLKDLKKLDDYKITLHIITQDAGLFEKYLDKNIVNIEYHLNIYGEALRDFLIGKSDLHFAMGTSALEGAVLGIPTVTLDCSYKTFPENYKYSWLFESEDFNLGCDVNFIEKNGGHDINEIFSIFKNDVSRNDISIACYNYASTNHSIENVVRKLKSVAPKFDLNTLLVYCKNKYTKFLKN